MTTYAIIKFLPALIPVIFFIVAGAIVEYIEHK